MGLSPRTLKFAVDIGRKAYDRLTDTDLDAQIETAAMAAGERAAEDDEDLDPTGVRDLIAVTLQDSTELAEGVDELIERGEPVAAETELLAEELARLGNEYDPLAAVAVGSIDWPAVAETFLETFEREVAATDGDQRWLLFQAYNQRVLDAVTPDEFAEARQRLTDEGFDVVSDTDFETEIESPRLAWREPFDWHHLTNDYAVDRYHGDSDRTFTEEVLATLDGGGHQLLFGPPGSGKTVACRQAAAAWHHDDETGPVIHWRGGLSGKRIDPKTLEQAVETLRKLGDTLVVVEDAARNPTLPIFEFLTEDLADEPDVSVLLDAREYELDRLGQRIGRASDNDSVGQSVSNRLGTLTERDRVPYLSVREIDEIFDRFAATTDSNREVLPSAEAVFRHLTTIESRERETATPDDDHGETTAAATETSDATGEESSAEPNEADADAVRETPRITPEQIRQTVGGNSSVSVASPMLMLSYYLPVAADDEDADTADGEVDTDISKSPLEQRVRSVFDELNGSDKTDDESTPAVLRRRAVLTIATLAAADLPIHESYLYALADGDSDYDVIESVIDDYRGRVHFGRAGEVTGEGKHVFRSPHELWGLTYLYVHEMESKRSTVHFEKSMNTVFSVIGDESVRRELGDAKMAFRDQTYLFGFLKDDPTQVADTVVSQLFQIGKDRPTLVNLFGRTRRSRLELPEYCSDETFVKQSLWRSEMYRTVRPTDEWNSDADDTDRTRESDDGRHQSVVELRKARETASERDVETDWIEERFYRRLGRYARGQGDLRAAEWLFGASLARARRRENDHGVASSLQALGGVARMRGALDDAEEYLEECSEKLEETADASDLAAVVHSLGNIALQRGELETAEECHERSLSIKQEIGDRSGEAKSLGSLGNIARNRGEFETAEEYHEQSLSIFEEIGDRSGEASSLHSLGLIALQRGELETAEEYHERSLSIKQEIGDRSGEAKSLGSLGTIARNRGEFETAEEYHERSLSIEQEIGDRSGEADSLGSLGNIALQRGEFETAEEYHERSLSIFEEIGDRSGEAKSLHSLGTIARNRGEFETATERYQSALAIFEELGQVREAIQTIQNLVRTAEGLDDEEAAIEWVERGIEQLDDLDLAGLGQERRWFVKRFVRLDGDRDDLEGLYTTALQRLLEDDFAAASDLLEGVWDCRESFAPETDASRICLRAGVGYAAPATQRDTDGAAKVVETVCEAVEPHRDRLSEPATALHDLLVDGATEHDPDALREPADREDPGLDDLERFAYAELLERLVGDPKPLDIYPEVIRAMVTDDAEFAEVVRSCLAAWDRHTDTEGDQYRAALAAGVVLEFHREFADELPADRESVFGVVRENREHLSEPIEALFEYLDTGATEHGPEALREAADREDPTLVDLERIAVAALLTTLQSQ